VILPATLAGTAMSLAALGYLAATDPKRRRSFRLPAPERRHPGAAWIAALAPGALVGAVGGAGAFFVWLGTASVLGWGVAAAPPGATAGLAVRKRLERGREALVRWTARAQAAGGALRAQALALARRADPDRPASVAVLESRVGRLEQEVADLRRALAATRHRRTHGDEELVVELARTADRPRGYGDLTKTVGKG
jgi:hypothetical protein